MTTLLVFNAASGMLLVLLALPLLLGKVPPNPVYGFRIAPALDDPGLWYEANKYAAVRLIWAGLSVIAAAVGLALVPGISLDVYALGCLAVFALVLGVGLVQSVRHMRALAREKGLS
jgi:hypothetical protein